MFVNLLVDYSEQFGGAWPLVQIHIKTGMHESLQDQMSRLEKIFFFLTSDVIITGQDILLYLGRVTAWIVAGEWVAFRGEEKETTPKRKDV